MLPKTFQEKLKALYQRQDKIEPLIEGLEDVIPQQSFKDHYTKPKMVIKVDNGKKLQNPEPITDIETLFDPLPSEECADKRPIHKLLIEGQPGVGKTTSLEYFAYKWSQEELWKDKFDYVYIVPLKKLLNHISDRQGQGENGEGDILRHLVHSHLNAEEENFCKLQEIPWKKDKTLFLLDGYDEVPYEDEEYKKVLRELFENENLILTSRRNAIDGKTAEKFERKIENLGFDHEGINQYLTRYFKDDKSKGLTLEDYLQKNSSIQGICHIPAIIAMLCSIWCEGDLNSPLLQVSNLSDLYQEVLNHIEFRNYAKQQLSLGKTKSKIASQYESGSIYLDEVQVLQHVAFQRLTDGDIEGRHEQRSKTLVIPGMIGRKDETGISIQSSINRLSRQLKREMPTIKQVCTYGLLRSDSVSLSEKKLPETALVKLNFSFTHLSFQEFLAARHFAEKLMDGVNLKEQENIANFIAQHRNEPRYLMTFKFLAGILSAAPKETQTEQGIRIFWEAIMCNTDGVLELGVENKVSLLMHLFSQAIRGDEIDPRIPHRDEAVKLIDSVVLGDLSGWKTQLRESDYTSDNIRKGLIKYFVHEEVDWVYEKSLQLKRQINPNFKDNHQDEGYIPSSEDIIDIIGRMFHKFSESEAEKIFSKGFALLESFHQELYESSPKELVKSSNEAGWRQAKKVIELFILINRKSNLEDTRKEKVFRRLLKTVFHDNLTEVSSIAIKELISRPQNSPLKKELLEIIKGELGDIKPRKAQYEKIIKLGRKCVLCDANFAQDLLKTLIQLLKSSDSEIRSSASRDIVQLVELLSKNDIHLVGYVINLLIPILKISKCAMNSKILASKTIINLMKFIEKSDIYLFRRIFLALRSFANKSEKNIAIVVSGEIQELLMLRGNYDIPLVQAVSMFCNELFQDSDERVKISASKLLADVIEINDKELSMDVLLALIRLLQHHKPDISTSASTSLINLLKVGTKFTEGVINNLIPALQAYEDHVRKNASNCILEVIEASSNGARAQLAQNTLEKLIRYWKKPVLDRRKRALEIIVQLLKISGNRSTELVKDLVETMTLFLGDLSPENRISASDCLTETVKGNPRLVQEAIRRFQRILITDHHPSVRKTISKNIQLLLIEIQESDSKLLEDIIMGLLTLSKNPEWNVKTSVAEILIGFMSKNKKCDKALAKNVLDILTPILKDQQDYARKAASENLIELMNVTGNNLFRDIIKTLAPLLQDLSGYPRALIVYNIINLFEKNNSNRIQVITEILKTVRWLLKNEDPSCRVLVSKKIIELMIIGGPNHNQLVQGVLELFRPSLSDSDWELASSSIIEVMKISYNRDPTLIAEMKRVLIPYLENPNPKIRISASGHITELVKIIGRNDNEQILEKLIPLLQDKERDVRASVSNNIIDIIERNGGDHGDTNLCETIFQILSPLLKVRDIDLNISASKNLIKLAMLKSDHATGFGVKDVLKALMLAPRVRDFDQNTRMEISNDMVTLLKMKCRNNIKLLDEIINYLRLNLQHSNVNLVEMSSNILKGVFLIVLGRPENLKPYFTHKSQKLKDILTSSLLDCLKAYVQSFQSLDELFQDPKLSLNLENINNLFNKSPISKKVSQEIQEHLYNLQHNGFSDDNVSKFKIFLASELNQIESLKGPQIIELALFIANEKIESEDDSNSQKLVDLAREVLNIQVKYLNDDGLTWIYDHDDQLHSLSSETKRFYRQVCHQMLEDYKITSKEEKLMIKFINRGLTISLTKSGEVIFEEKCYKLEGEEREHALEKFAKTIIRQRQDVLALQYKENKPIFKRTEKNGMRKAAADKKKVQSIVDSRFLLTNDSWLLTILKAITSNSKIVILEHRSAFGDHFIYHLSKDKILRFYPKKTPPFKEIFGSYLRGERYQGEIKELTDQAGQKLFESKDITQVPEIRGRVLSDQIYFQQRLLREGSEDRNEEIEKELEKKRDDDRRVLEGFLEDLNLTNLQKKKILEYYEGSVSTFCDMFRSAGVISVGQVAIDDGADFFSLTNVFKQLCSFAPYGIGGPVFDTFDAFRSYLHSTKIQNLASFVKDIAISDIECSDLVGRVILNIAFEEENRKRIFDVKEEQQVTTWLSKAKSWVMEKFEKLKKKAKKFKKLRSLFLEQIRVTPAFQLGINDANKMIQKWIELKQADPSLRMDFDEKCRLFMEAAVADESR